jgi:hypothetical protein
MNFAFNVKNRNPSFTKKNFSLMIDNTKLQKFPFPTITRNINRNNITINGHPLFKKSMLIKVNEAHQSCGSCGRK